MSKYKVYQIDELLFICSIGVIWSQDHLSNCIANCFKLGINENSTNIMIAFINHAKGSQRYQ